MRCVRRRGHYQRTRMTTMVKRAVLVLGPESSGTRLVTRILIEAGCAGSDNHVQPFDWTPPNDESPIVWRRSLPHMKRWLDLGEMTRYLRTLGYMVSAVITDRKTQPMIQAQARDHTKNTQMARSNIARARLILTVFDEPLGPLMPVTHVQYEDLVANPPQVIQRIINPLGLESDKAAAIARKMNIYDGNAQYAEEAEEES